MELANQIKLAGAVPLVFYLFLAPKILKRPARLQPSEMPPPFSRNPFLPSGLGPVTSGLSMTILIPVVKATPALIRECNLKGAQGLLQKREQPTIRSWLLTSHR